MPRIASPCLCLPLGLALLVGACATSNADYPSLAVRDIERVEGSFAVTPRKSIEVPPVKTDLAGPLDEVLADLVAQAEATHGDFLAIVPRARQLAAVRGSRDLGSPAWAAAEVALSELESARSLAAVPLGDVDMLYTAARVAAEDVAAIEDARARILALITEQDDQLAQLRGAPSE